MDDTDGQPGENTARSLEEEQALDAQEAEADRVSDDLRNQIQALRRQVLEAQDALREHQRRRQEPRTFKR